MSKNIMFTLLLTLSAIMGYAQDYVDEDALFMKIVNQVRSAKFDVKSLDGFNSTAYINRKNRKVSMSLKPALTTPLTGSEIYQLNRPNVYRFIRVFKRTPVGKPFIENVATAIPISSDGYFLMNHHMVELVGAGSEDPSKIDTTRRYLLADYAGNIFAIDSIVTYNKEADLAIVKADVQGKSIEAFAIGDDLRTGDPVHIIAHPKAFLYYYSTGVVNRFTQNKDDIYSRKMEVSADYAGGSSGGPVFDRFGNLIGLVSSTQSIYYDDRNKTNLQMVVRSTIPFSVVRSLIEE